MAIEDLRQRYLWIAKNSLEFLKDKGFKKKGKKYVKQKGELILEVFPMIPRAWLNQDESYEFEIWWDVLSSDQKLIQFSIDMGAKKIPKAIYLIGLNIIPDHLRGKGRTLTDKDPSDFDQKYVEGIKKKLEEVVLPLFDRIHSFDDVIRLAEEEAKLERNQREFFSRTNIYRDLTYFYAAKGWKEKTIKMCDKDIEETPEPVKHLAEEDKRKYIKYFEKTKKI
jgi:hypothetical protein